MFEITKKIILILNLKKENESENENLLAIHKTLENEKKQLKVELASEISNNKILSNKDTLHTENDEKNHNLMEENLLCQKKIKSLEVKLNSIESKNEILLDGNKIDKSLKELKKTSQHGCKYLGCNGEGNTRQQFSNHTSIKNCPKAKVNLKYYYKIIALKVFFKFMFNIL